MSHQSDDWNLIQELRAEAGAVKDCFTRFLFQSITLAAIAFGFIVTRLDDPLVCLVAIPVIMILMAVSRIGIFKYDTANRNYGYELHLERLNTWIERSNHIGDRTNTAKLEAIRHLGWEEACRAWRVVQSSVFRQVYTTPQNAGLLRKSWRWLAPVRALVDAFDPWLYRFTRALRRHLDTYEPRLQEDTAYPWFLPRVLTEKQNPPGVYHISTYLRVMLGILAVTQYLLLAPMAILIVNGTGGIDIDLPRLKDSALWCALLVALIAGITLRYIRVERRREILENELLCIHSWSIMWHYVAETHFQALGEGRLAHLHYTERLAKLCPQDLEDVLNVPLRLREAAKMMR